MRRPTIQDGRHRLDEPERIFEITHDRRSLAAKSGDRNAVVALHESDAFGRRKTPGPMLRSARPIRIAETADHARVRAQGSKSFVSRSLTTTVG
ncbi:hypothetical protein ASG03_14710 [Rhizobium sp. Leaf341]|nr:hypothetical protein ASG03_14710 [Rhizobium sp. Leaf341]